MGTPQPTVGRYKRTSGPPCPLPSNFRVARAGKARHLEAIGSLAQPFLNTSRRLQVIHVDKTGRVWIADQLARSALTGEVRERGSWNRRFPVNYSWRSADAGSTRSE